MILKGIEERDRPFLFIPLKSEYYEQFESGKKTTEYRLYGKRWTEDNVWVGRPAVISKGYGKKNRINAVVDKVEVKRIRELPEDVKKVCIKLYGYQNPKIMCIGLTLEGKN